MATKKIIFSALGAVMMMLMWLTGFAETTKSGRELHNSNCVSCHDDGVYQRTNRIIKTMAGLKTQIRRCETTLDLTWFDEELDSVAEYLNNKYYQFK